jgi:hypothetical protein
MRMEREAGTRSDKKLPMLEWEGILMTDVCSPWSCTGGKQPSLHLCLNLKSSCKGYNFMYTGCE